MQQWTSGSKTEKEDVMAGRAKILIYKSGVFRKSWKWKMIAPNGEVIASGRGFNSQHNAEISVGIVKGYFETGLYYKQIKI